ncbi:MAG: hypothetical protein SV375_24065, partial [Thermodesulfobacteriota bacterium]|nr:hypothetical protein [Thermodesulfobacteriota bacterium]
LDGKPINTYISRGHYWHDIGTIDGYVLANGELLEEKAFSMGADCHIDRSVRFHEWAVVGEKAHIEKNVEIKRSILWENVRVRKGVKVFDSIVTSLKEVDRDLIKEIF